MTAALPPVWTDYAAVKAPPPAPTLAAWPVSCRQRCSSADATAARRATPLTRACHWATRCCTPNMRNAAHPRIRGLVYTSTAMAQVASRLSTIAGCDANLLILGATGTGKEVCALAAHYLSGRASKLWIAVNCGAIPGDLVENELFGHVKGAYTTALTARSGLVREAEGGTLFLDDVDCLPLPAQAKLLRFLQEREYRPVGSNTIQHADVRVIAASNCDLHALSLRGAFRQDLYFRLNVLRLKLPALCERREDIAVCRNTSYCNSRASSSVTSTGWHRPRYSCWRHMTGPETCANSNT